jgi:5-(carboxyamino)imidazole ribonucleotide synthase
MDKTIGIFGGGQLGRMMAQAALPLNIQCTFLKPNRLSSSGGSGFSSQAEHGLSAFIQSADVFSLEFENTPLEDVDALSQTKSIYPPRQALAIAQNRFRKSLI